jgi:hypothetical protein
MNITEITDRIKKDPLALAILEMIRAMSADYGRVFKSTFPDKGAITDFKQRAYIRLRAIDGIKENIGIVTLGYETASRASPDYPPNLIQLDVCIRDANKAHKLAEINRIDAERVTALPTPTISCDPIRLYKDELKRKVSEEDVEILTREERMAEGRDRMKKHIRMLVIDLQRNRIRCPPPDDEHSCYVSSCNKPGTQKQSGGNFYCSEHNNK